MDRHKRLLQSLAKDQKVIELGASHKPLVSKRDGWNNLRAVDLQIQEMGPAIPINVAAAPAGRGIRLFGS